MKSLYDPLERTDVAGFLTARFGSVDIPSDQANLARLAITSHIHESYTFFASNFAYIADKRGNTSLLKPFVGQAIHRVSLDSQLRAGLPGRLVEVKARQLGWTTENLARALHFTLDENKRSYILVDDERVAAEQATHLNAMLNGLPHWMQPMRRIQNMRHIVFENPNPKDRIANPGLGSASQITVPTSFRGVGGSIFVCISEYAHMDEARQNAVNMGLISAIPLTPYTILIIDTTPNGCISAGSLVPTSRGLVRIENLKGRVGVGTTFGLLDDFYDRGTKPVVRVTTKRGISLVCTPDHRLKSAAGGWVEAKDALGVDLELTPATLPDEYAIVDGQAIDERWGRFLGYFMGDGSYYEGRFRITCDNNDPDVIEDVAGLLRSLVRDAPKLSRWGMEPQMATPPADVSAVVDGGCTQLTVARIRIGRFFEAIGAVKDNRRAVCVPDVILQSPRAVVREFLRGLFESDGSAHKRTTQIHLTSSYLDLLRDVQLLLTAFGIVSHIRPHMPPGSTCSGAKQSYRLVLNAADSRLFNEHIGFISDRKRARAHYYEGRPPRRKPATGWLDHDTVVSVEAEGEAAVYDLSIGGLPQFGANGIVVHNCGDSYHEMVLKAVDANPRWTRRIETWNSAKQGDLTADLILDGILGLPDSVERGRPGVYVPAICPWHIHDQYTVRSKIHPLGEIAHMKASERKELEATLGKVAMYGGEEETDIRDRYGVSLERLYWRRCKIDTYGLPTQEMNLLAFRQEFLTTIDSAFVDSGATPFPRDCMDALSRHITTPIAVGLFEGENRFAWWEMRGEPITHTHRDPNPWHEIRIYAGPENDEKYTMGVDTDVVYESEDSDFTVAQVVRVRDCKLVATYMAKVGSHELIKQLYCLYRWYNNAYYAIETAGMGYDLVRRCIDAGMANAHMYKRYDASDPEPTKFPGWETAKPFMRQMMDQKLLEYICHRNPQTGRPEPLCIIPDARTVSEIKNLVRQDSGAFKAPKGRGHDDHVDALEIAWCIADDPYSGISRKTPDDSGEMRHEFEQRFRWVTGGTRNPNRPSLATL